MVRIFSAGGNPTPIAPIPPPAQTPRARSAVPPAKAMPALAKGWRQPKRSVIRVEMLPILSDLPQTDLTDRVVDRSRRYAFVARAQTLATPTNDRQGGMGRPRQRSHRP